MRTARAASLTIFGRVSVRGRARHGGDDRARTSGDPVHAARIRPRPAAPLLRHGSQPGARRAAGPGVQDAGRCGGRRARRGGGAGWPPAGPEGACRRGRRQASGDGGDRRRRARHRLRGGRHLSRRAEAAAAGRDRLLRPRIPHGVLQRRPARAGGRARPGRPGQGRRGDG